MYVLFCRTHTYFAQLVKKYERGDLPKSDWLDALAFRKMAEIHAVRLSKQGDLNVA